MKKKLKYFWVASIALNVFLVCQLIESKKVDRIPPWHPFELNSELTLKSIVEDGYSFASMPCGQVQYTKKINDTIVQYEVEVDCNKYIGAYKLNTLYNEEEASKEIKNNLATNPYYPWNLEDIESCYQKIDWRVFTISLGTSIDSLFVKDYVSKKGGYVVHATESWDTKKGGSFMVNYPESSLYFFCRLSNKKQENQDRDSWVFVITGNIPPLNQDIMMEEKKRKKKLEDYYNNLTP